jgi:hypothetical protein
VTGTVEATTVADGSVAADVGEAVTATVEDGIAVATEVNVATVVGGAVVDEARVVEDPLRSPSATPSGGSSSTCVNSADGVSDPGTLNTTGEPTVTRVPARGNCSTTVPGTPSSPSTTSTMAGDPMVLNTPAANWTVFPTTEGTSNSCGASLNKAAGSGSDAHPPAIIAMVALTTIAVRGIRFTTRVSQT